MKTITITNENFESEVINSDKPVLIDFWATWCGPCKMVSPVIDQIAEENPEIKVGKVNVDNEENLARKFGVMSIPTLVIMKNGKITNQAIGAKSKAEILNLVK